MISKVDTDLLRADYPHRDREAVHHEGRYLGLQSWWAYIYQGKRSLMLCLASKLNPEFARDTTVNMS